MDNITKLAEYESRKKSRKLNIKSLIPTVFGWGINDVNYKVYEYGANKKVIKQCPYYMDWKHIITRCHSDKYHSKQPTYVNCTISEKWQCLSNFIKWVDSQPNRDWQNCVPDKDLLIEGNKHYGPATVVYIPSELNKFITDSKKARGRLPLGVCKVLNKKTKPYQAYCSDPFSGRIHIGYFQTAMEAHKAWQAKKHEYACQLADLQQDPRVADALRQRYAPDKDWTTK